MDSILTFRRSDSPLFEDRVGIEYDVGNANLTANIFVTHEDEEESTKTEVVFHVNKSELLTLASFLKHAASMLSTDPDLE